MFGKSEEAALSIRVRRGVSYTPGPDEQHAGAEALNEINQSGVSFIQICKYLELELDFYIFLTLFSGRGSMGSSIRRSRCRWTRLPISISYHGSIRESIHSSSYQTTGR